MTTAYVHASAVALALSGLTACAPDAKLDPTWIDDVRPMVQANCLRCHASPAIAGAPTDFRLDVYEDTVLLDGRIIRGAATMAPFVAARAGEQGTMPPDFERTPWERDTFSNWYEKSKLGAPLKIGTRSNNAPPSATLLSSLAIADKEDVTIEYEIVDNDADMVSGVLLLGTTIVADSLFSGRGSVTFSPASFPDGTYPLIARISDDLQSVDRELGSLQILHEGGNAAPSLVLNSQVRDQLFSNLQSPVALQVTTEDVDGDQATVSITAYRGQEEIVVASDLVTNALGVADFAWDTTAVPAGPGWRLRVVASDAEGASSTLETGSFVISHGSTDLRFVDVQPLFNASCRSCHPRFGIRNMPHNFGEHGDSGPALGVDSLRGLIYRRVVLERNMPPLSAEVLVEEWRALTDEEIDTISDYLLGGSPL